MRRQKGKSDFNLIDAMKFQLTGEKLLKIDEDDFDLKITNGEWLETVLNCLVLRRKWDLKCIWQMIWDLVKLSKNIVPDSQG